MKEKVTKKLETRVAELVMVVVLTTVFICLL